MRVADRRRQLSRMPPDDPRHVVARPVTAKRREGNQHAAKNVVARWREAGAQAKQRQDVGKRVVG